MQGTVALVTGGAGFIGCNLVRHLRAQAWRVVVLDKLTYAGRRENLADLARDPDLVLVQGDIGDRSLVTDLLARHRPAVVINLAAETHVDRSIDSPRPFVETNLLGTFELLDAVRLHWRALPTEERERFRFLHVSTDEVYGSAAPDERFVESTPYAPNSPYAASKAGADHLVRAYHSTYDLPALVTNCSNNYGPFQFPEKLIPLMILNAVAGQDLPIYGDGGNVRDWIFVEDHCAGIRRVAESGRPGEKYNLGGGNAISNLEIVDRLCAELERQRPARDNPALVARGAGQYTDLKRLVVDRPGHDRRYAIDSSKAERELGWKPAHDLAGGLQATVGWYLDNPEWCRVMASAYGRERLGVAGF